MTKTPLDRAVGLLCSLALVAAGCSDDSGATTSTTTTSLQTTTSTSTTTTPTDEPDGLFEAVDLVLADDPFVLRQRAVTVDLDVLLRANGKARDLDRVVLNLFPDTVYTGVIVQRDEMGNGYTWVGYLEGYEVSALTMVWTGAAFAANFATPEGVYEVDSAGEDTYRVKEINQEAFPGEG